MIVVGAGRVGRALCAASASRGIATTLVSRTEGWEALAGPPGAPIVVATRNDDLEEVLARVPDLRHQDLVFVQNGMIRELLLARQLGGCTRGLLYFAVAAPGDPVQPGGPSPFTGPHAPGVAAWLGALGLEARVVDWARFSFAELEKAIWLAANGPLCMVHRATVGEVAGRHRAELAAVVDDLRRVGRAALGVDVPNDWLVDQLCAYSLTIPDYRASVKEWRWRNGWFADAAARHRVPTPAHDRVLRAAGL